MSRNRVEDFGPHQDAVRLFDHVVDDMQVLRNDPRCYRLVGQQVGSADSICANIDEGFGRMSRTEFIRFLDIARGSARETLGRYKRLRHWLPADEVMNA
jgi:four helix bundle protein